MPEAQSPESEAPTAVSLWAPVVVYMAFIFALSSITHPPALPHGADKGGHALLYCGFGLLLARARSGGWRGVTRGTIVFAAVFGAIYGVSDELHQYFNPPRNVEAYDVVADTIGSTLGAVALQAWGIIRSRNGL